MSKTKLHIREDSDSDLDALFSHILKPQEGQPTQVPMRMRKLPTSFFTQPDQSPHHSRQGSADSLNQLSPHQAIGNAPSPRNLTVNHAKSFSSPATLDQSISVAPTTHNFMRHGSIELSDETPLPPGWEMAITPKGERYFLNHITQTTTWQDPRKTRTPSNSSLASNPASSPQHGLSPAQSLNSLSQGLGPLVAGWEQSLTPEGEVYFINHLEKITTWFDPRIPAHLQRPAMKLAQLQQIQQTFLSSKMDNPQENTVSSSIPGTESSHSTPPSIGGQLPPAHVEPAELSPGNDQRLLELRKIYEHKRRLQKEQQQLAQKEKELSELLDPQMAQMLEHFTADAPRTALDPFLGPGPDSSVHVRQESGDSGVGVSSTGSSSAVMTTTSQPTGDLNTSSGAFPRTPDDLFSKIEDMDTGESRLDELQQQQAVVNMMNQPHSNDFMHIKGEAHLDSDELMASIPGDDMLDQILGPNNNHLLNDTWL